MSRKVKATYNYILGRGQLKSARQELLGIMESGESFDINVREQTYRCFKRPAMYVQRPKINKNEGTFTMQEVLVKPTIVIRKIKPRKEN